MQFKSCSSKQHKLRDYFGFLVLICGVLLGNRFMALIAQSRTVRSPLLRMSPPEAAGFISERESQTWKLNAPASPSFTDITTTALDSTGFGSHSSVFADVTGDGRPDLYITMFYSGDMSDLFYQNTDGTHFTEDALNWHINDNDGGSHGATFADLDNDGDYDLINGTTGENNNVYRNDSNADFTDMTPTIPDLEGREEVTRATVAFDMDGDGYLDIFTVTGYLGSEEDPPDTNEVYHNEGGMSFAAIDTGALYEALAGQGATDTDYDGDGDIDIIAANRTGNLNILQNDGSGNFTQISPSSIGINHGAGDGITMGDVDNDGDLDMLLVSDYPSSVAYLYMNDGDGTGTFTYDSQSWQNIDGYMGGFADLDNDGDLDLVFAGDSLYYLNDGNGNFSTYASCTVPDSGINDPRAIAFADIDNDGDMDFGISPKQSNARLIRNEWESENNWLKVRLISPQGQAGAFGSKIRVYPGRQAGVTLLGFRESRSSNGYLGQNEPVLHFGLGSNGTADVVVTFLDGSTATRTNVTAGQTITIDRADVLVQVRFSSKVPTIRMAT